MQINMKARKTYKQPAPKRSPTVQEMKATLSRFKPFAEGRQVAIGAALGINQGQLSKILRGDFSIARGNALALFEYASKRLSEAESEPNDRLLLQAQLTKKLLAVWDGSVEGATALEAMFDVAARLRRWR
jgi:hypothetical protein